MMNEADTCRKFVLPKLLSAGWENAPHAIAERHTITDGRIVARLAALQSPGERAETMPIRDAIRRKPGRRAIPILIAATA